eukprot:scaffold6246_cov98-Isochrysis_galbana.AAC.3
MEWTYHACSQGRMSGWSVHEGGRSGWSGGRTTWRSGGHKQDWRGHRALRARTRHAARWCVARTKKLVNP